VRSKTIFNLKHILTAVASASITIIGYVYVYEGQKLTAQQSALNTQYQLNAGLIEENQGLRTRLAFSEKEKVKLEIRLLQKYQGSDELKIYLDNMRHAAAWIKKITIFDEKPLPVMWYINRKYEEKFSVSAANYVGKSDFQFWQDQETASRFYANDMRVYKRRSDICLIEEYPLNPYEPVSNANPLVEGIVCKWMTVVEGEPAIAGMIIDINILGFRHEKRRGGGELNKAALKVKNLLARARSHGHVIRANELAASRTVYRGLFGTDQFFNRSGHLSYTRVNYRSIE